MNCKLFQVLVCTAAAAGISSPLHAAEKTKPAAKSATPAKSVKPAEAATGGKSPIELKASKIIIPELSVAEMDLNDCLVHFVKQCQSADPEKVAERKGINLQNRVTGETKKITLKMANISAWDAAQAIAVAAGVKVSDRGDHLMFHDAGFSPLPMAALTAWRKTREWQAADAITLKEIGLAEATMEEACAALTQKAAAAAPKGGSKLTITAAGVDSPVSLHAENVKLSALIEAIAGNARAEIATEAGKVILRPFKPSTP